MYERDRKFSEPLTLFVGEEPESAEATRLLQERGVPFYPQRVPILENGLPEATTPKLITPVGSFSGLNKIRLFTGSFYDGIVAYLKNS